MGSKLPDSREFGRLFALSQVGLEMVIPIIVGVWIDNKLGWAPWGVIVGAVLGLGGGLWHLVVLLKRFENKDSPPPQD